MENSLYTTENAAFRPITLLRRSQMILERPFLDERYIDEDFCLSLALMIPFSDIDAMSNDLAHNKDLRKVYPS